MKTFIRQLFTPFFFLAYSSPEHRNQVRTTLPESDQTWLRHYGTQVTAMVVEVSHGPQEWRMSQAWETSSWHGALQRQRVWSTCCTLTIQWLHPYTHQQHRIQLEPLWSMIDIPLLLPTKGDRIDVFVDTHVPTHVFVDKSSLRRHA